MREEKEFWGIEEEEISNHEAETRHNEAVEELNEFEDKGKEAR